jgi:P-type E1-E2 ATPase
LKEKLFIGENYSNNMIYNIPPNKKIEINTIILDLNGTLSVNGKIPLGVKNRLNKLKKLGFKIILFTGDQRGTASKICKKLGIDYKITFTGKDKEKEILKLNPNTCASIGNGKIDIGTFKHAKLSILTLQAEGISTKALPYTDILVLSIVDALDLFLNKDSLCATLRE